MLYSQENYNAIRLGNVVRVCRKGYVHVGLEDARIKWERQMSFVMILVVSWQYVCKIRYVCNATYIPGEPLFNGPTEPVPPLVQIGDVSLNLVHRSAKIADLGVGKPGTEYIVTLIFKSTIIFVQSSFESVSKATNTYSG